MKVSFQLTLDEMVDVTERTTARSRVARGLRWRANLAGSAASAIIAFVLLGGSVPQRMFWAAVIAVLGGLLCMPIESTMRRSHLRKYLREQLGGKGPFTCEVELTPGGLVVAQTGTRGTRDWSSVSKIEDTPDGIEFIARGGRTFVVRNRAFASPESRGEFLRLARSYAAPARVA